MKPVFRSVLFSLLIVLVCSNPLWAQPAELLLDIYPGTETSFISNMTTLNGQAIFRASNTAFNGELWVSDGTLTGTSLLTEIYPGLDHGCSSGAMVEFNGFLYFTANDGVHGFELWKTDGTEAGTQLVRDLLVGANSSYPRELTVFQGALYFSAFTESVGAELWRTQGDSASTELIEDLIEGPTSLDPQYLFATDAFLFFTRTNNQGLYRSDGTALGTIPISTNVVIGQLDDAYFTLFENWVYFRASDVIGPGAMGSQLWRSNGITVERVTEIVSTEADLNPVFLTVSGDKLYFVGEDYPFGEELWVYTNDTVQMVRDINPSGHAQIAPSVVAFQDKLLFTAWSLDAGMELWVSDGTFSGTYMLQDIHPGSSGSFYVSPVIIDNAVYFSADDGDGEEIWKLVSPTAPAFKFTSIEDGAANSSEMVKVDNTFLFTASTAALGTELWRLEEPEGFNPPVSNTGNGIQVWPNPARDFIQIHWPNFPKETGILRVMDITGKIIHTELFTGQTFLNTARYHLQPGVYLIHIQSQNRSETCRVILKE